MRGQGFDSRGTSFSDSNTDIKTGRPIKESLRSLDIEEKTNDVISDIQPRAARNAVVSTGRKSGSASGGAGIDSPLTEISRVSAPVLLTDSTGLLSVSFDVASQVTMKDKGGREVVFVYA